MSEGSPYVYLATPIDFANRDVIRFREQILGRLLDSGFTVYDPASAWHGSVGVSDETLARRIESANRFALRRASVLVAWLPEGVATHGVPMEIEFASRQLGIPTLVIGHVGLAILSNPQISVLPERALEKLGHQVELLIMDAPTNSQPTIRFSAPEGTGLDHAYPGDAGVDLRASADVYIPSGKSIPIPTGVKIELPSGTFGWVVARSSTWGTHGLMVMPGIIDENYQGELFVMAVNAGPETVTIGIGTRIAQLLLLPNMWPGFNLVRVDEENVFPNPSSRGSNGFGSSGR